MSTMIEQQQGNQSCSHEIFKICIDFTQYFLTLPMLIGKKHVNSQQLQE